MFFVTSSPWLLLVASLGSGVAIKLMDDDLDDTAVPGGVRQGRVAYALMAFLIGVLASPGWAAATLAAAYAVGMGRDWRDRMPSRLTGWQESLIAIGIGGIAAGPAEAAAILAVGALNIIDHVVDNDPLEWGLSVSEALLLAVVALGVGAWLRPGAVLTAALVGAALIGVTRRPQEG